jgi:hypothetical protein
VADPGQIRSQLEAIDAPLLLVRHEGCILFTDDGFADAAAAFPDARTATLGEKPSASIAFAATLKEFCTDLSAQ